MLITGTDLAGKMFSASRNFRSGQEIYAHTLHSDVFTPQIVINGSTQFVGSDRRNIEQTIQKIKTQLSSAEIYAHQSFQQNTVSINYTLSGNYNDCSLLAALTQNKAVTEINAGENGGASLTEYNIVRDFKITDAAQKGNVQFNIPKDLDAKNCSIILFLQQKQQGKIIGAAILHS